MQQRSDLVWAQGLVARVETALTQVKSIADQSPFNNDFLCMDSKDIRKKYGDEEAGVGLKKFCEQVAPLVQACEQARAKLISHMRVG